MQPEIKVLTWPLASCLYIQETSNNLLDYKWQV